MANAATTTMPKSTMDGIHRCCAGHDAVRTVVSNTPHLRSAEAFYRLLDKRTASHACIARRRIMFERSIEVRKVATARNHPANMAMATMPKSPMDGIETMVRKRC
mmetsp:Transcript_31384/g.77243  ORF Transcript_31384/g.77243 Transcript_31384/m.77243 type:complete len:105 (-) Transcript_31384:764-1078(-)